MSSTRTTVTSPQSLDMSSRKTAVVEPSTDLLKDKECTTQRNRCSKRARQKKHGNHPTILSRWYGDEDNRKSLSAMAWDEHHKILYDRIALEKHIYTATRAERIQNSKHWILTANAEGGRTTKLRAMKNTTTQLTRKQVAGSTDSRGPTCKQLRHHRQRGTKPSGRRGFGILNIL